MTAQKVIALYYEGWQNKQGDLGDVPLAEDFEFRGPVASFDNAEAYRAMAREAGRAVTRSPSGDSSSTGTPSARSSTGRWRFPGSVR